MRTLLTRTLAGLALSVTLASAALAVDSKDNAALRYWRAFSFMNESRELDAHREQIPWDRIGAEDFAPPQVAVEELLKQRLAIQHGVRAAFFEECDFGIDYDLGLDALLPHLGSVRRLAQDMLLDARLKLDAGDPDAAIERLCAAVRSAQHIQSDRLIISALVSMALTRRAEGLVVYAASHPAVTDAHRDLLSQTLTRFDRQDPFQLRRTILWEGAMMSKEVRRVLTRDDDSGEFDSLIAGSPEIEAELREISGEIAGATADREAESYLRFHREAADIIVSGEIQRVDALQKRVDNNEFGSMVKVLAPAFGRIMQQDATTRQSIERMRRAVHGLPIDGN